MTKHALINDNGGYVRLPPYAVIGNASTPAIWSADSSKKYDIGTLYYDWLDVYAYCYAGGTVYTEVGAYKNKKTNTVAVAPAQSTVVDPFTGLAAGVAGSYYVTVTIDTEIGVLTTGVLSENELSGGFIVIGNGSAQHPQNRYIVSHPALTSTGGSLTVKLDKPLSAAVTAATTTIELCESPFYCVIADGAGGDYATRLGIAAVTATSGQYFWLKIRGLAWITSNSNTCDSAQDRTIVWVGNGSVVSSNDVTVESGLQIAGVAMDTSSSGSSNAPIVYLNQFG
jgi:hypothetical protein